MKDHRNLRAFVQADALVVPIYRIARGFPREETYGLTAQLRRAALSVPTNIVEGCGRGTHKEYVQFLQQAMGSSRETGYLIEVAIRLGYLNEDDPATRTLRSRQGEASETLAALIRALRRNPQRQTLPASVPV